MGGTLLSGKKSANLVLGSESNLFHVGSAVDDDDGHLFWTCPCPPRVKIRDNPEFHDLMKMDNGNSSRCFLWLGGCLHSLMLMVVLHELITLPWASLILAQWRVPDGYDANF